MKSNTKKLVFAAMLAAVTCVATLVIHIPSPLSGYINLGECFVLLSGWLLGPLYGPLAAGIGAAVSDLFLGYGVYAPATFVIKSLTALVAYAVLNASVKFKRKTVAYAISGITAELVMVGGYYVFEGAVYDFGAAVVNVVPNAIQAVVGVACAILLIAVVNKTDVLKKLK